MSLMFLAAFMMAQAAADVQQPAAVPAAPAAAVPEKPNKPKLICKREDADSGSHMSRRTCMTAEQWNGGRAENSSRSGMSISGDAFQRGH
jgi:hypothetical protein